MNEWQKTMQNITFDGKHDVLQRISEIESGPLSIRQRINNMLNYELVIPTQPLIALCTLMVIAIGVKVSNPEPSSHAYGITVINERGEYEKTY